MLNGFPSRPSRKGALRLGLMRGLGGMWTVGGSIPAYCAKVHWEEVFLPKIACPLLNCEKLQTGSTRQGARFAKGWWSWRNWARAGGVCQTMSNSVGIPPYVLIGHGEVMHLACTSAIKSLSCTPETSVLRGAGRAHNFANRQHSIS